MTFVNDMLTTLGRITKPDLAGLHPAAQALLVARANFKAAFLDAIYRNEKWETIAHDFGYSTAAGAIRAARSMGIRDRRKRGPKRR